jgi:SAM-dependent methyltransferase
MQYHAWEQEYKKSKLLTLDNRPQGDVVRFVKFLKKELRKSITKGDMVHLSDSCVLDLGSGTGRNAYYFASQGATVIGIEISTTAVNLARERAQTAGVRITYHERDMSLPFPVDNASMDVVLDVTSSNSLDEAARIKYLREVRRVLKPGGFLFLKTLCKDGDDNAKYLLKHSPGKEYDTYFMKDLGLYERVFSREDLVKLYTDAGLSLVSIEKKTSYPKVDGRVYKRNSWVTVWRG